MRKVTKLFSPHYSLPPHFAQTKQPWSPNVSHNSAKSLARWLFLRKDWIKASGFHQLCDFILLAKVYFSVIWIYVSFCVVGGELRTSLTQCLPPFCPAGADNHGKRRAKPDRWKKRKVEKRTVTYQTVTAFSKEEELTKKKKKNNKFSLQKLSFYYKNLCAHPNSTI